MVEELFNKGDKAYLKGKYGMYYNVIVKRVEEEYAFIQGDRFIIGNKKVKIDKLRKEPSETFQKEQLKINDEIRMAEEELYKFKNRVL